MSTVHPVLAPGKVAVVTGAASGIGRAAAERFAALGMRVCLVDRDAPRLEAARAGLATADATAHVLDVADRTAVAALAAEITGRIGPVALLMNNAAIAGGGDALSNLEGWERLLAVNVLGVLHGVQAFVPAMAERGEPGLVINTGSKQGITQPPGDTAYNVTKSAVKALTEGLAHTLRTRAGCRVTAHLLIPGFTYTGMTGARFPSRPPGAWMPEQVVDRLLDGIARDEFYILCQDDETTRTQDERRILWATHDIIDDRPALSRWHPDWQDAFARFMADER